jgi:glutathione S-transferase
MYKLYGWPGYGSFAPQAVLEDTGAPYEFVRVNTARGEHRKPEFLKLNPMAQVPVLVLADGTVMTESAAMVIYLADKHGRTGLAPKPDSIERAVYLRWLVFMSSNIYDADLRLYYPERYSTDAAHAPAIKAKAAEHMSERWAILDKALGHGPYLLGDAYCAADAYFAMLAQWCEPEKLFAQYPRIRRHTDLVRKRPAIARIWNANFAAG